MYLEKTSYKSNELNIIQSNKYEPCLLYPRAVMNNYGTLFYVWPDRFFLFAKKKY